MTNLTNPPTPYHLSTMVVCTNLVFSSHTTHTRTHTHFPPALPARDPQLVATQYHPQWSHCPISSIPEGATDDGSLPSTACSINKTSPDSALRVSFNGNIRLTGCDGCCMRWFITINGSECADPAPIDGVLYTRNAPVLNVHRAATITGICRQTENGTISPVGLHQAVLNVGMCDGFNESYNAYTGFQSVSTMNLEELPTRK